MADVIINKEKIIAAIQETDDNRILFAISRLLEIEETGIPEWHKEILEDRLQEIQDGVAEFEDWDTIKASLFRKK
jgi:Putative addiction module component